MQVQHGDIGFRIQRLGSEFSQTFDIITVIIKNWIIYTLFAWKDFLSFLINSNSFICRIKKNDMRFI